MTTKDKTPTQNQLQAPWRNNPNTRELLIQRINKSPSQQTALSSRSSTLNDQAIAEEYYRMWLELPAAASPQRISQHPLITLAHRNTINKALQEQKMSQIKWASGGTAFSLLLYSIFLSRTAMFRKFFNNQHSYAITRGLKKTLGVYGLFLVWVGSLTNSYQQSLPDALAKEGLLKQLDYLPVKKE